MGIINEANLDAANTAFETAANGIFGHRPAGTYQLWTKVKKHVGTSAELPVVEDTAQLREWLGSRTVGQLRAYTLNKTLRRWERTLKVPVDEINGDKSGVVAERLRQWVASKAMVYDFIMYAELLANPTGYDGVSLLSNSHPTASGTQDNLTTSALEYSSFSAGKIAMREFTDYKGEPLDMAPTHVVVGADQEQIAMQVTGSDKLVGIDDTGDIVQAGGSGIDANVGVLKNYHGGEVVVVVSPRITGNEWFMMDLGKGEQKPMYMAEFQSPRTDIKDDPNDDNVFYRDEVIYGLSAKVTPMAMNWQCVYGSVTA